MGFHLIDQTACFAVGQPTVRVCTVPNGRSTQGVNSGCGSACVATAATCFFWVACMAYPTPSGRSMDCSAAIACCAAARSCRAKPYIGSLAVSMALLRLRQLSACMCRRPETWGQHQKKAGRWPWREKRCSWFRAPCRDFETTCTAFSSTKQVGGMLKTRDKTCGQPCG